MNILSAPELQFLDHLIELSSKPSTEACTIGPADVRVGECVILYVAPQIFVALASQSFIPVLEAFNPPKKTT